MSREVLGVSVVARGSSQLVSCPCQGRSASTPQLFKPQRLDERGNPFWLEIVEECCRKKHQTCRWLLLLLLLLLLFCFGRADRLEGFPPLQKFGSLGILKQT